MLKHVLLIVGLFAFAKANSQQSTATATSTVILYNHPASIAVKDFFVSFHAQDTVALKSRFVEGANLQSLAINGSEREMTVTSVTDFIKRIAGMPATVKWEERLTSVQTIANDHIASVHTDYDFYVNNTRSHQGRNVFTLVFIDDQWKITQITDTRIR